MPPAIRIPTEDDFKSLSPDLVLSLYFPSPRESTTAILILLHGLGGDEASFAAFARSMSLPGVLAISLRGTNPLPPALLGEPLGSGPPKHFHWGDDLNLAPNTGDLDPDPGFEKAADLIQRRLVQEVLVDRCGWRTDDILFFGFGQGGSLALGLASKLRIGPQVEEVTGDESPDVLNKPRVFKGIVSIGGPLPQSMVPTISSRPKSQTPVMICHGRNSELIDDDAIDAVKAEFDHVQVVQWSKAADSMPGNRDEMLPIMKFLAERLRTW